MIIRVKKGDAAYFYQLLESYEGVAHYTTLTEDRAKPFRDIEVQSPESLRPTLQRILGFLRHELDIELIKE